MLSSQTSGFPITVSVAGTAPAATSAAPPTVAAPSGTPLAPAAASVAAPAPASGPGLAYTGSPATFDLALAFAVVLLGAALARAAHVLPSLRLRPPGRPG
jgi:hypothetical protein